MLLMWQLYNKETALIARLDIWQRILLVAVYYVAFVSFRLGWFAVLPCRRINAWAVDTLYEKIGHNYTPLISIDNVLSKIIRLAISSMYLILEIWFQIIIRHLIIIYFINKWKYIIAQFDLSNQIEGRKYAHALCHTHIFTTPRVTFKRLWK